MKRRNIAIFSIGVITLIATIIVSALCIDNWSGITGWAFSTMLLTEIVFFGGLIFTEWISERTEQVITRSALYVLLSAYAVINIPVSIIYLAFFKQANTTFAIVEVVLLSVLAISIMASLTASRSIYQNNSETMGTVRNVEAMIGRLTKLSTDPKCEAYKAMLKKLSDDLRLTDISVSVPADIEIDEVLSKIETELENDTVSENINGMLTRLHALAAQRKMEATSLKKGSI